MTQRAIKREPTALDPMFFIPEGVDELVYDEDLSYQANTSASEGDVDDDLAEVEFNDDNVDYGSPDDVDYTDAPETPQIIGIIPPQVLRTGDSGAEVVDVILEVEDVDGVTNYELRVTKI